MIKFKEYFTDNRFNAPLDEASVKLSSTLSHHTLYLKFDSKDVIEKVSYTGTLNPWFSSMCELLVGKSLHEALLLNLKSWESHFQDDQAFWDLRQDIADDVCHPALELLHGALDVFRGREYLYQEESPLVCRCFGIRESDIIAHLQKNEAPTLESLSGETKAGMGCRTCVPQLKKWVSLFEDKKNPRYYKDRPVSEWLLTIDHALSSFSESRDWKMEIVGMKGSMVQITFEKEISQIEEEAMAKKLQGALGRSVDPDLTFFLRSARHFSKAKG